MRALLLSVHRAEVPLIIKVASRQGNLNVTLIITIVVFQCYDLHFVVPLAPDRKPIVLISRDRTRSTGGRASRAIVLRPFTPLVEVVNLVACEPEIIILDSNDSRILPGI